MATRRHITSTELALVSTDIYGGDLAAAILAAGSNETAILVARNVIITSPITVPFNVTLQVPRGVMLTVNVADGLVLNGGIEAGPYQIFDGTGNVTGKPKTEKIYFQWFGCVGDNTVDDTAAVNKCLAFVSENGCTAYITEGTYFRTLSDILIWGKGNIEGASMYGCGFVLDTFQPVQVGSSVWFNIGIENLPITLDAGVSWDTLGTLNRWQGRMGNFTVKVNDAGTDHDRLQVLQIHGAFKNWDIDRVFIDLSDLQETDNAATVASLEGNSTAAPAGEVRVSNGVIRNCEHVMTPSVAGGCGAINLIKAAKVLVHNNRIVGCTDDAIVFIDGEYCVADSNWVSGTKSRIGPLGGVGHRFINNHIEREPDGGGTFGSSDMLVCMPNASIAGPSPQDCSLVNNTVYVPAAADTTITMVNLNGSQGTLCQGNTLVNDSPDPQITGMRVGTYTVVGWLDPKGVEAGFGHGTQGVADNNLMRPRSITVKDNVCTGEYPVTIEEYATSGLEIAGPITYENNVAESYSVFGINSFFRESNKGLDTVLDSGVFDRLQSRNFLDAKPVATFFAEGIRAGLEVTAESIFTGQEFVPDFDSGGFLVRADVEFDGVLTGDGVNVVVYKGNFSTPVLDSSVNASNFRGRITSDDPADPSYNRSYSFGSSFGVKLTGESELEGIYDAKITLYKITTMIGE